MERVLREALLYRDCGAGSVVASSASCATPARTERGEAHLMRSRSFLLFPRTPPAQVVIRTGYVSKERTQRRSTSPRSFTAHGFEDHELLTCIRTFIRTFVRIVEEIRGVRLREKYSCDSHSRPPVEDYDACRGHRASLEGPSQPSTRGTATAGPQLTLSIWFIK